MAQTVERLLKPGIRDLPPLKRTVFSVRAGEGREADLHGKRLRGLRRVDVADHDTAHVEARKHRACEARQNVNLRHGIRLDPLEPLAPLHERPIIGRTQRRHHAKGGGGRGGVVVEHPLTSADPALPEQEPRAASVIVCVRDVVPPIGARADHARDDLDPDLLLTRKPLREGASMDREDVQTVDPQRLCERARIGDDPVAQEQRLPSAALRCPPDRHQRLPGLNIRGQRLNGWHRLADDRISRLLSAGLVGVLQGARRLIDDELRIGV